MLSASILCCCSVNTVATTGTGPVAVIASIVIIVLLLLGCVPVIAITVVVIYRYVWQNEFHKPVEICIFSITVLKVLNYIIHILTLYSGGSAQGRHSALQSGINTKLKVSHWLLKRRQSFQEMSPLTGSHGQVMQLGWLPKLTKKQVCGWASDCCT